MRIFGILVVLLISSVGLMAQTVKSPPVKSGKKVSFDLGGNTYDLEDEAGILNMDPEILGSSNQVTAFGTEFDSAKFENFDLEFFILTQDKGKGRTLQDLKLEYKHGDVLKFGNKDQLTYKFKAVVYSDRRFLMTQVNGTVKGVKVEHLYIASTILEGEIISLYFISSKKNGPLNSMRDFATIVKTFKVVSPQP